MRRRRRERRRQPAQAALAQQRHDLGIELGQPFDKVRKDEQKAVEVAVNRQFLDHVGHSFRPADERPAPPLIAWSPYGKHAGPQLPERYPDGGVAPGQLSEYTAFESPDPVYWAARGYAVVNADIPGTWFSGGDATFLSPEEAE